MSNKFKIKRSTTASSVPTGLEAGEIAVNITDKRLFVGDGTNSQELTRRAASSNTNRIQLAASTGALADSSELTFADSTNKTLALGSTRGISIINDPATGTTIQQNGNPGAEFLLTHPNSGPIWIGDRDGLANNTYLKVHDSDGVVDISGQSITLGGTVTTGNIKVGSAVYGLQLGDNDGSHYVEFKAPATVASNVTLTLPSTAGSNGQVLTTNGTGTLSWTTPSGGSTPDFLLINAGII